MSDGVVLIHWTDKEVAESIVHEWITGYEIENGEGCEMSKIEYVGCLLEWERRGFITSDSIESLTDYQYNDSRVAGIRKELFNLLTVWAGK